MYYYFNIYRLAKSLLFPSLLTSREAYFPFNRRLFLMNNTRIKWKKEDSKNITVRSSQHTSHLFLLKDTLIHAYNNIGVLTKMLNDILLTVKD